MCWFHNAWELSEVLNPCIPPSQKISWKFFSLYLLTILTMSSLLHCAVVSCMHVYWFIPVTDCLILTSSVEGGEAVCPGEEVTLTCTVTEGVSLGWISEPYVPWINAVTFTSTEWLRVEVPVHRDPFQIVLRNITSNSSQTNLTSILSFVATSTLNGTVVKCDPSSHAVTITLHHSPI